MIRDFVKINEEDLVYAEEFFQNEKHFNEWLINVFNYYRGREVKIKTKIVEKYFNNYKKTMDFILNSIDKGKKGQTVKAEKQALKNNTLEGVLEVPLEPSLEPNNKVISNNSKVISKKDVAKENLPLTDYQLCVEFWLKEFHPDWDFKAVHGKALKSIIKQLSKIVKDTATIPQSFTHVCKNLPEWYKNKDLQTIDSKFNEIITEIKNKANGTSITKDRSGKPISKYAPD
jgi:uncharacterized protein (UPF0305 family)